MIIGRAFLCAVAFLSRIPVPGFGTLTPRIAGLSVAFFPAVGLLLGAVAAGAAWTFRDRPPHMAWALLLVALHAFLTGALHLDGLSDIVDGLGGARGDRARALEIMKDPRVGAFGVVALVVAILGKVIAMDGVLRLSERVDILLAYPMLARWTVIPMLLLLPCARSTGLARTFHEGCSWSVAIVSTTFVSAALWTLGGVVLWPTVVATVVAWSVGVWIAVRLGGLTGDAHGASIELAELAFLFTAIRGG